MRILANYGYKNNGDSYSVTFETMGDCPKDQADSVVDELFSMAKRAIERQLNPQIPLDDTTHTGGEGPDPKKNGNGHNGNGNNGHGKNGNGGNGHSTKDDYSKCTAKQKNLIIKLAKERGQFISGIDDMSKADASYVIEDLLAVQV